MVHWRFTKNGGAYHFGYVTYESGPNLIRMDRWNGDSVGGQVVSAYDIEWEPYHG